MNTREAILKAADHIEANPGLYDFQKIVVPGCGTPGCMVGWVGCFKGISAGATCWWLSDCFEVIMDVPFDDFERRMDDWFYELGTSRDLGSAKDASTFMRLYAEKYHPAEPIAEITVSSELDRIFATVRESVAA